MPELRLDITGQNRDAVKALNDTATAGRRAGDELETTGRNAQKAQGGVGNLTGKIGALARSYGPLAAAAAGGAVLKFGLDSVKAASNTQQAFGAIDSVFKGNQATVKTWANNAATDVGLARSEYGNLAVVLGSMLKNTGIEDYATKTNDLIKLGADLAATYGGSVNDAVDAVGSLMRGETDPIERYGVSIKQADVTARLAADGLGKLEGKAKTQAEQQARLKLLFEQTSSAQGAFGRESNTLAGQQERLNARFTNLKDTLGQKLLPVATQVVTWLSNTVGGTNATSRVLQGMAGVVSSYVTPIIRGLRDGVRIVADALAKTRTDGGSARDTLRDIGKVAGPLVSLFGRGLAYGIRSVAGGLATLIAAGAKTRDVISSIVGAVDRAISAIGRLADRAGQGIPNPFSAIGGLFRSADQGGLARASGLGLLGGPGSATRVAFTSAPQVVVNLDARRLAEFVDVRIQDQLVDVFGAIQVGVQP